MISPALRPHLTPQLVSLADNDGKGRGEEEEEGWAEYDELLVEGGPGF